MTKRALFDKKIAFSDKESAVSQKVGILTTKRALFDKKIAFF